ncbi:MAG: winged helix-turn-helix domain-containing protein [Candidatus Nitrotoga sp.]
MSKGWTCRLRNQFIAGGAVGDKANQFAEDDTENTSLLSAKPNCSNRSWSQPVSAILVVSQIKPQLEMALSSVCKLLHRHNWRKLEPDKRHPQSNPVVQEDWKKTPRNTCQNPPGLGQKRIDSTNISGRGAFWAHQ